MAPLLHRAAITMHLTEQSNVVKSATAAYSQKYQLCKAVTGLATFSTLIVVYKS